MTFRHDILCDFLFMCLITTMSIWPGPVAIAISLHVSHILQKFETPPHWYTYTQSNVPKNQLTSSLDERDGSQPPKLTNTYSL